MRTRWVVILVAACVTAGTPGPQAQESQAGDGSIVSRPGDVDVKRLLVEGRRLSPAQVAELELALATDPSDLAIRTTLLGFYSRPDISLHQHTARRGHVFWIIENRPDAAVCGTAACKVNSATETQAFQHARELWNQAIEKNEGNAIILGNAARFMLRNDPEEARRLLDRARGVDPSNPEWPRRLAAMLAVIARYGPPDARQELMQGSLEYREAAYTLTTDETIRLRMLPDLANAAIVAGQHELARKYANQALESVEQLQSNNSHGDAVHHGNVVLGRVALIEGDSDGAKAYLLAAGKTPGSPELNIFGPSMALAAALLEAGESEVVLEYLELCRTFWARGTSKLDQGEKVIQVGGRPRFGRNREF